MKLTDLQQATADHIMEVFDKTTNPTKQPIKYLLADEVGLGKTIIAADVINTLAKAKRKEKFIVYYVCGNERVTIQNKNKLADDCDAINTKNVRLSMQRKYLESYINNEKKIVILPLTPAVTFTDLNSSYNQVEADWFKDYYQQQYDNKVIAQQISEKQIEDNFLAIRNAMINAIITDSPLKPDMVILDEFQNYDGLLYDYNQENQENPEYTRFQTLINQAQYVLMLSATPFSIKSKDIHNIDVYDDGIANKRAENNDDSDDVDIIKSTGLKSCEDSYKNVLTFILGKSAEELDEATDKKAFLYNHVFCRTERSMFYDAAIKDEAIKECLPNGDAADTHIQFTCDLIDKSQSAFKGTEAEYISWIKASPHPLAFATRYAGLKKGTQSGAVNDETFCSDNATALAEQHDVDYHNHAGFAFLKEHVLPAGVENMLWIPSVIFKCPEAFRNDCNPFWKNKDYTKTLVFCTYRMSTASTAYYLSKEAEDMRNPAQAGSSKASVVIQQGGISAQNDPDDETYYNSIFESCTENVLKDWVEDRIFTKENMEIVETVTGLKGEAAKYRYARMGDLKHVLDEFLFLNKSTFAELHPTLKKNLESSKKQTPTKVFFFEHAESYKEENRKSLGFAERFTDDNGDNSSHSKPHERNLQFLFNAPFRPFVLSASATAQEGLDFHNYSHCMAHFSMPKTPVEYQQREGRIDRYRSHLMRKRLYMLYPSVDSMEALYIEAEEQATINSQNQDKRCSRPLFPNWYIGENDFPKKTPPASDLPCFKRLVYAISLSQEATYYKKLKNAVKSYEAFLGSDFEEDKDSFCPYLK